MLTVDRVLDKHTGIRFPFDKRWKRLAAEYCAERLDQIEVFRALGLQAVSDLTRRNLIASYLGPMNGHEPDDYNFNVWVLNEAIGDRVVSDDIIFWRCLGCYKIRTSRGVGSGPCKCRGTRLSDTVGPLETGRIIGMLALGY